MGAFAQTETDSAAVVNKGIKPVKEVYSPKEEDGDLYHGPVSYTHLAPFPSSESSWSPADWLVMEMLVPRFCPKLAATSLTAFASMDPGMKMPSCPSLSYTASFTGMRVPPYST